MFSSNAWAACVPALVVCAAASVAMFGPPVLGRSSGAPDAPVVSPATAPSAPLLQDVARSPVRRAVEAAMTPAASARIPQRLSAADRHPVPPAVSHEDVVAGYSSATSATSASNPTAVPEPSDDDVPRIMYCHPDLRGPLNAADVLQDCIDRAPAFSSVEIPAGTYVLHRQVIVSRPVTIRTAGSAGTSLSCRAAPDHCVILMAAPDLFDAYGFLFVRSASNVMLEHVVLDGNRDARLSSAAARSCQAGRSAPGFNAAVVDCIRCALDDVVSRNALCGTAMVWSGAEAVIRNSEFGPNGDATTPRMWADGLTVVYAPESEIRKNRFVDNSDIGLIVGHAARSRIEQNVVLQRTQSAFAGLMLDNFNSNRLDSRGDFRGAVIANNTVDCGSHRCVFGIQVGPGPWYPSRNIVGGDVHDNEVRGAKVGINVDGAGVRLAPTTIYGNRISGVPARAYFSDCRRPIPTGWMNVSPTSVVDRRDEFTPTGAHLSDACQLWSDVAADAP